MSLTVTNGKSISRISSLPYSTLKLCDCSSRWELIFIGFSKVQLGWVINYESLMSVVLDHFFFLYLRVRIDHLAYKRAYLSVPVKPWPVFWLLNILVKCQVTKYRKKSDDDTNWWHYVTTVKKGLARKTFRSYPCQWFSQKFRLWLIIYDS